MKKKVTLISTGRRTAKPRPVSLYAFDDDDRLVIVGSAGGKADDPAWVANLRADPQASVRDGSAERAVRAREVDGSERDRLWRLVVDGFPLYETYQRRTKRTIPLFVLEPAEEGKVAR
jgi:deazaflavin-dependent oxidoreductase (nitroreductase family)